jgi:formate hydrogenlyase subunit 6/NADH:ubiquinone oxidoreductase subunit I
VAGLKFERYGKGIAKGMALTLKHALARPSITTQYPEERLHTSRRIRGPELVWDPERCTVCATCAKACPQGNITIVSSVGSDNSENEYVPEVVQIDHGRCMFCGLCVEACPFEALHMGREYERASYRRRLLVENKEELVASEGRQPSGYFRPGFEAALPEQTLLVNRQTRGVKTRRQGWLSP